MGNPDRETLLRETYRLNHELGYVGFRHQYFNDPAAIEEWPDPAVREIELRDFWETGGCDSVGEGFASYRKSHAHATVEVLTAYRDYLRGLLAGDTDRQIAYYKHVTENGRSRWLHEEGFGEASAAGLDATPLAVPRKEYDSYLERITSARPEPWPTPNQSSAALAAFDRMAANLSEQWAADGFAAVAGTWEALSEERKIGYLADVAGAYRVPFERFEAAARSNAGHKTRGQV